MADSRRHVSTMAKDRRAFKSSFINRKADLEIDKLFRACVKLKASDLHLKVDKPPMVRVNGTLRPMNREPITDEEMVRLCFPLMNERNRKIFEKDGGADFAHTLRRRRHQLAVPRQPAAAAGSRRPGCPPRQQLDSRLRRPVPAAGHREALPLRSGHGAAGRRHGFRQEHDDRLDAQLDQSPATASTSSRSKTRSNSCSPKTSA